MEAWVVRLGREPQSGPYLTVLPHSSGEKKLFGTREERKYAHRYYDHAAASYDASLVGGRVVWLRPSSVTEIFQRWVTRYKALRDPKNTLETDLQAAYMNGYCRGHARGGRS